MPDYSEFSVSQLRCVIGNNAQVGNHRSQYNGVFNISAPGLDESPFVAKYAGLNLEHYFDAGPLSESNAVFFEPRYSPMTFERIDDATAELHQPPTPNYGVESWTRFTVREPYYIDMAFRCAARRKDLVGNVLGVFWASYINDPDDTSMHFLTAGSTLDSPMWVQYCTQEHGRDSTVCYESAKATETLAGRNGVLFTNVSPLRYSEPFFCGLFRDRVLIYMFKPDPRIRFSHSPTGGGPTLARDRFNPAWDFHLLVPDYEPDKEYTMEMRFAYKPWKGRADVLDEVRAYLGR